MTGGCAERDIGIGTLHDLGDTYIYLGFSHAHIIVAKILGKHA